MELLRCITCHHFCFSWWWYLYFLFSSGESFSSNEPSSVFLLWFLFCFGFFFPIRGFSPSFFLFLPLEIPLSCHSFPFPLRNLFILLPLMCQQKINNKVLLKQCNCWTSTIKLASCQSIGSRSFHTSLLTKKQTKRIVGRYAAPSKPLLSASTFLFLKAHATASNNWI